MAAAQTRLSTDQRGNSALRRARDLRCERRRGGKNHYPSAEKRDTDAEQHWTTQTIECFIQTVLQKCTCTLQDTTAVLSKCSPWKNLYSAVFSTCHIKPQNKMQKQNAFSYGYQQCRGKRTPKQKGSTFSHSTFRKQRCHKVLHRGNKG